MVARNNNTVCAEDPGELDPLTAIAIVQPLQGFFSNGVDVAEPLLLNPRMKQYSHVSKDPSAVLP